MHHIDKRLLLFCVVALIVTSCNSKGSQSTLQSYCGGLFVVEKPLSGSEPPRLHIPTEALPRSTATRLPEPALPPATALPLDCSSQSRLLPVETVFVGTGGLWGDYLVSPDEGRMALQAEDGVSVLDLNTGSRQRLTGDKGSLLYWTGNQTLILSDSHGPYEYDLIAGRTRDYAIRWEYNGPDTGKFDSLFYTGWQACEILEVSLEALCQAVRQGQIVVTTAQDGSLLIPREELAAKGAGLVRQEHQGLLTYDQVAELRSLAKAVSSVVAGETRSPIRKYYWPRILILHDLPAEPRNLLVYAASESQWSGYPSVDNQLTINHGGVVVWTAAHPTLYVAPYQCPKFGSDGYELALYRKPINFLAAAELGRIPYPIAYGTRMDWSPTKRYIYFKQSVDNDFSVSRLSLDSFVSP